MGILTLVLLLGGFISEFKVPFWVMLACASAITLGILSGAADRVLTVTRSNSATLNGFVAGTEE